MESNSEKYSEGSDPKKPGFVPDVLDKTVITSPLFEEFRKKGKKEKEIIGHMSFEI